MRRRPHHLPDDIFKEGSFCVSLTLCTAHRAPLFSEPQRAGVIRSEIDHLHAERASVLGYCIMPDHVHMVLIHRQLSLAGTVRVFKGRASRRIRRESSDLEVWQPGYYDHVVRKSEGMYRCLQYVFENPVRKGLTTSWWEWPWSGAPALGRLGADLFAHAEPEDVRWQDLDSSRD
jgi:putative transposase